MNKFDIIFVLNSLVTSFLLMLLLYMNANKKRKQIEALEEENKQLKENLSKSMGLPMKTNYKNDVEFLDYLIGFKVENIKIYHLQPLQLAQTTIIGDKEYATWKEEVIHEVYSSLSPSYKRLLQGYFTDQSLIVYITEQVSAKLTSEILSANFVIK